MMLFLAVVVIASGSDIAADISHGASALHLFQEAIVLLIALIFLCWLIIDSVLKRAQIRRLNSELEQVKTMPMPDSETVLAARHQLRQAITEQFDTWQLTNSEKDVGQMLLKGYSLKEVAALRGTAEKTIRQQASSIYHKAGLPGRHAFSAWFIEDLL
ncbi:helix-turn-helix transcriptional regulator [Amphritea japonica]|uniref:LuxR family transcriptional regulator n=1 Tax=Amphritea japonica ATCC BAA-1530 TaxID=1278309 RepID=A0A7R6P4T4_9GAMM|nr:LuxR C-terminal-related transcriptional regulator [Amphritea japonica]BBB25914.1 LuxR family transcriptional regulator [Amphritea japonica ATCC BAA-1530]